METVYLYIVVSYLFGLGFTTKDLIKGLNDPYDDNGKLVFLAIVFFIFSPVIVPIMYGFNFLED